MSLRLERWNEAGRPDAKILRKRLEREGYSVSENTDQPGTRYEPHSHESDQTHWILSGEAEFVVENETYTLRAGDRDYLPANTEHSAAVVGSEPVRYLVGVK